ncbi:MAG: hypothetical protein ACR2KU_11040 [Gammaproteobacteria bacterium]|nr:hypothetical protein [Gammaproteobacteria bacterium]
MAEEAIIKIIDTLLHGRQLQSRDQPQIVSATAKENDYDNPENPQAGSRVGEKE